MKSSPFFTKKYLHQLLQQYTLYNQALKHHQILYFLLHFYNEQIIYKPAALLSVGADLGEGRTHLATVKFIPSKSLSGEKYEGHSQQAIAILVDPF